MPETFANAAKFYVGLLGAVLVAASTALDNPPQWLGVVIAVLTAIGVYLVPNAAPADALPPLDAAGLAGDDSQDH